MGSAPIDHRTVQRAVLDLVGERRTSTVALASAAGHVLATEVATALDQPPFDNSAMDGYAVRSVDLDPLPARLRVVGVAAAGRPAAVSVGAGQAVRILTGAATVAGADCIVPVEDTDAGADVVEVRRHAHPGAHIRRAGEGARAGEVVLRAGTLLNPGHLGVAASAGADRLDVVDRARVAIVVTGDELVPPGEPLGPGQIPESNAVVLAGLVRSTGAAATVEHCADDADELRRVLEALATQHDVVLTTGGVSMGAEYDVVREALAGTAVQVLKVAIRPAKPLAFGTVGDALFVGLPGNPVSVVVSFELFVRPALRALAGIDPPIPPRVAGIAGERFSHPGGEATHFLRVRPGSGGWVSTGSAGSHLIAGTAAAQALAVLAPGAEVARGEQLELVELWTSI